MKETQKRIMKEQGNRQSGNSKPDNETVPKNTRKFSFHLHRHLFQVICYRTDNEV
jgi:hypothetical protein